MRRSTPYKIKAGDRAVGKGLKGMGRTVVLGLVGVCLGAMAWANMPREQVPEAFARAGRLYKEGRYDQAARLYEEILASGFESGPIYYNLGNSYFKNGRLGLAILNYERARRLLPRDRDLLFNRRYALRQAGVTDAFRPKGLFWRLVDRHRRFYTSEEMVWILVLAAACWSLCFFCALFFRWPRVWKRTVLGLLAGIFCVYALGFVMKLVMERREAIVIRSTEARFEPRSGAVRHFALREGYPVGWLREQDQWVKIKRPDGRTGWVPKKEVRLVLPKEGYSY